MEVLFLAFFDPLEQISAQRGTVGSIDNFIVDVKMDVKIQSFLKILHAFVMNEHENPTTYTCDNKQIAILEA